MAPKVPNIPESERSGVVVELLEVIKYLQEQIQGLKDEIAILKKEKAKPKVKGSGLGKGKGKAGDGSSGGKRPGSVKRDKTQQLRIDKVVVVPADDVPEGSRFKGFENYTVQELVVRTHNTTYRLERWLTPDGRRVRAELPAEARVGHFGPTLISFVLYLYHQAHVTQPLIVESLHEFGVDISTGQVNRIITEGKERWHTEKAGILQVGLEVSQHIHVDDTGARHKGKNGYSTHIGNDLFAWFQSTESKSRVNFLTLLRAGARDYVLDEQALAYMNAHQLPKGQQRALRALGQTSFADEAAWKQALVAANITRPLHVRLATEGALIGSIAAHGLNPELVVVSDDAPQFDVLKHALCWVHAERTINKIVGFNEDQRTAIAQARGDIWDLYRDLKAYKEAPCPVTKAALECRFDVIMTRKTCMSTLNHALKRLHRNKSELLLVLERPDIPLHNNSSESDIRDYVKKRKISGSTRSDDGRKARDTFATFKKTCRKLGVSFWRFLNDGVRDAEKIGSLPELMRAAAMPALGPQTAGAG
jgi:hypothetical protein